MLLLSVSALAWMIGGNDERRFSMALIGASLATLVAQMSVSWAQGFPIFLIIDLTVLLLAVSLALKSRRYWPIWFSAFQFVSVITTAATFARPGSLPKIYGELASFWALPALLAMAVGMLLDHRAKAIEQGDRSLRR